MKKQLTRVLAALMLVVLACATTQAQSPKRAMRSIWLTSYQCIDWPSARGTDAATIKKQKAELIKYLDDHQRRNFTGVCFHVRTWADALYRSSYEPWSEFVSGTRGKDPGWDPLAFVVEEGHKRGLEVYAWVNPYRFNRNWRSRTTTQDKAVLAKADWIINQGTVDQVGTQTSANEYQVFNPALPDVREYLLKIFREIYMNYRIDGMLFDDYFYPNSIPPTEKAMDYKQFHAANPGHATDADGLKKQMGDWRRANINLLMRQLYEMIQQDRPDLRFGLAPAGVAYHGADKYREEYKLPLPVSGTSDWQYDQIYSDPIAWLAEGSVDFISPQIYWFYYPGSNSYTVYAPYEKLVDWWSVVSDKFDRHLYVSMAPYRMVDGNNKPVYNNETHWADLSKQIETNRRLNRQNASGEIYFSSKYMDGPLCSGWGDYLQEHSYQCKSLMPVITWKEHAALSAPAVTRSGNTLTWSVGQPSATDPIMRYSIYAVPSHISKERAAAADGDGIDCRYLLGVSYGGTYEIPAGLSADYWYAVCAYDGYGYESAPAYVSYPAVIPPGPTCLRDPSEYETIDHISLTNLWYRSTTPAFNNISFIDDGKANRSICISGDYLYLSGRAAHSADADAVISQYGLESGELVRQYHLAGTADASTGSWACNDICSADGQIYFTNLTINAKSAPLTLHRFDPSTGKAELIASLTPTGIPEASPRIDHAVVVADNSSDGSRLYVYAAVASGVRVCRWTVVNGSVTGFTAMQAKAFYPATSANFGIAPRVAVTDRGTVFVNGGSIHPTEYDFATGQIVASAGAVGGIAPSGMSNNGIAHFGTDECFTVYPHSDHYDAQGYKFSIVRNGDHGFSNKSSKMWTLPAIDMGSTNSTTLSTPVATRTAADGSNWTTHVALLATGNTLAVYKMQYDSSTLVDIVDAKTVTWQLSGNSLLLGSRVASLAVYTPSGALVAHRADTDNITLPLTPGLYIVRADNTVIRLVLR